MLPRIFAAVTAGAFTTNWFSSNATAKFSATQEILESNLELNFT